MVHFVKDMEDVTTRYAKNDWRRATGRKPAKKWVEKQEKFSWREVGKFVEVRVKEVDEEEGEANWKQNSREEGRQNGE